MTQILQFLRQSELFENVPTSHEAQLARLFMRRKYAQNSLVFEQGANPNFLFLILSGKVELRKRDLLTGIELLLSLYSEGRSLGEEAVLTETPYPYFAIATQPCELLLLKREHFGQILQSLPMVGAAAAAMIARRTTRFAAEKGIRFINLTKLTIDQKLFLELPKNIVKKHNVALIARRGKTATLAMVNPHDLVAYDEVKRIMKGNYIEPVGVSKDDFDKLFAKMMLPYANEVQKGNNQHGILPQSNNVSHQIQYMQDRTSKDEDRSARLAGEQIIRLLNRIIGDGLELDASDIHIEPSEEHVEIRYRIDGRLWRRPDKMPIRSHNAIVGRMKALAGMNITDRRRPQDGRLSVIMKDREITLRLSTLPTRFGEKVVIRILDRSTGLMSLDRIIDIPNVREKVRELVTKPHGIVLVTGPTGSGKTTTMYSAILERKTEGINIVTIEDPIEYSIPGITQVQFNQAAGLGYAEAIRAFLRQDTDIMLIGETRDPKTAQNAMQAALSGHLVVTSLHTNSALASIYRLQEMGIERFLIANAVVGVIAQRLVRRICQDCRQPKQYEKSAVQSIYGKQSKIPQLWHGKGCKSCNNTGTKGRVAALEVVTMTEELGSGIAEGLSMSELKSLAIKGEMITLRKYCKYLLRRGLTTPHEVLRVLYAESESSKETKIACKDCGYLNETTNKFCEECGETV